MKHSTPSHRIELGIAQLSIPRPLEGAQKPESVLVTVTPDLMHTLKDVQKYLHENDLQMLPIEVEPDAWLPTGIDVQLRLDRIFMTVDRKGFRFVAESKSMGVAIESTVADVRFLEAEMARLSLRHRALAAA